MEFSSARQGYVNLFNRARILPNRHQEALRIARQLAENRARYEAIAAPFGCPWWIVACVHKLESGARWDRHLHNGDSLKARTHQVPAGRPPTGSPPFTFEESARDALMLKGWDRIENWELPRCLFELERYNGFGYVARAINSPYLWSMTDLYTTGYYVADGKFDARAVSQQCGAAAIIKALGELGLLAASIRITAEIPLPPVPVPVEPARTPTMRDRFMRTISTLTGGRFFSSATAVALIVAATPALAAVIDLSPIAEGGLTFLNAVLTGLASWVSWYVVSWVSAKTGVEKAVLNRTLGEGLEKGMFRGIDLAYAVSMKAVHDNPNLKFEINNPFLSIAANYVLANYADTLSHLGWDRTQLIRALILRAVPYLRQLGVPITESIETGVLVAQGAKDGAEMSDEVFIAAARDEKLGDQAPAVRQAAADPIS